MASRALQRAGVHRLGSKLLLVARPIHVSLSTVRLASALVSTEGSVSLAHCTPLSKHTACSASSRLFGSYSKYSKESTNFNSSSTNTKSDAGAAGGAGGAAAATRKRAALGDMSFKDMKIAPQVLGALTSIKAVHPSSIQRLAIPSLLRRWDPELKRIYVPPTVAIQDYTGSGKTFAYAIPILSNINNYIDDKILPARVAEALNELKQVPLPVPANADLSMAGAAPSTMIEYGEGDAFSTITAEDLQREAAAMETAGVGEDDDDVDLDVEGESEIDAVTAAAAEDISLTERELDIKLETSVFGVNYQSNTNAASAGLSSRGPGASNGVSADGRLHQNNHPEIETRDAPLHTPQPMPMSFLSSTSSSSPSSFSSSSSSSSSSAVSSPSPASSEAVREQRLAALAKKLGELFPHLPAAARDPAAPASRLQAIVVVPTRELAVQVGKSFEVRFALTSLRLCC